MTDNQVQEVSENELIALRREKLSELREKGVAYRNDFRRENFAKDLHEAYGELDKEDLAEKKIPVKVAGRMMMRRLMGKASFVHLQEMTGKIQLYLRNNDMPEGLYDEFKKWDLGDIIGATGYLFKTKTGELSVHVEEVVLLSKALRPLPDKFHGLSDQEARYRQRYLDLIANPEVRETFEVRAKLISGIREFLKERHFTEVETPMMHPVVGGALAKPFTTHHNALDMGLFLRIAPELYLKRLVVGGLERVFEINRNFRNEGLSTRHNPEFTMLEFYQAYADYKDLMDLTEELMRSLANDVLGSTKLEHQGEQIDFAQSFDRMTVIESILHFNDDIKQEELHDLEKAKAIATRLGIKLESNYGLGKVQIEIFEKTAEHRLMQPTFITEYPAEVSPLARRNNDNDHITDRDEDYITALEHGLPPTAGEGIGIDRLTMLFTDSPSIRDVILFPLMKRVE